MNNKVSRKRNIVEIDKNPPFFQFYKENFGLVTYLVNHKKSAAKVFMFIVSCMDNENAVVVSQEAIMQATNIKSRTTVSNSIKYLVAHRYLTTAKSGVSLIYFINCQLVWQMSHTKKKYAKFNANVYITEAEQIKKGKTKKYGHYQVGEKKFTINPNKNFEHEK
jgi:hypothetical protein